MSEQVDATKEAYYKWWDWNCHHVVHGTSSSVSAIAKKVCDSRARVAELEAENRKLRGLHFDECARVKELEAALLPFAEYHQQHSEETHGLAGHEAMREYRRAAYNLLQRLGVTINSRWREGKT